MVCTKCGEKLKEYEENNKSFSISLDSNHVKFNVPVIFKDETALCDQCCSDFSEKYTILLNLKLIDLI